MAGKRTTPLYIWLMLSAKPARTVIVLVWLFIAIACETLAVASLLPLLLLVGSETASAGGIFVDFFVNVLDRLDLDYNITTMLAIIVGVSILRAIFQLIASYRIGVISADLAAEIRARFIDSLTHAKWGYFVQQRPGNLASAIQGESVAAAGGFVTSCRMVSSVVQILVYIVIAILLSWQATIYALVFGLLIVWLLRSFVRRSREAGRQGAQLSRAVSRQIISVLTGVKPLKAMGREAALLDLIRQNLLALRDTQRRNVVAREMRNQLFEISRIIALAIGVFIFIEWNKTSLEPLIVLLVLFLRLTGRINGLQRGYQVLASSENSYWLLRTAEMRAKLAREETGGSKTPNFSSSIALDRVSFSYGPKEVLHDVSMTIPKGSLVAVVGRSGAGKTTMVDLICGLQFPNSGSILLDGVPLNEFDLRAWRGRIGYVPQETILLDANVYENVAFGESVPEEKIVDALRRAGAWDFVSALPNGIGTFIGDRAGKLSGGQRQRLALARAMIREADLLILDEATSALDPETEREIWKTLKTLTQQSGMTILAISHRKTILESADHVYLVEGGRVEEAKHSAVA